MALAVVVIRLVHLTLVIQEKLVDFAGKLIIVVFQVNPVVIITLELLVGLMLVRAVILQERVKRWRLHGHHFLMVVWDRIKGV